MPPYLAARRDMSFGMVLRDKGFVMRRTGVWTSVLVIICLSLPLSSAVAQDDAAFLKYRQSVMKSIGANMSAIGTTLKTKLPFQANIASHAKMIQQSAVLIESAFKKEITEGKTDSKPDVWKEWDHFVTDANKTAEESSKLAEVAAGGDMAAIVAQVKALGKSCGGCHRHFRKPKEERFKR